MVEHTKAVASGWDRLLKILVIGFACFGAFCMVAKLSLMYVAPHFRPSPATANEAALLDQKYSWSSLPAVDVALRDLLVLDTNQAVYPDCMSNAIFIAERNGMYRMSSVIITPCEECVMKVNVQQVDYFVDGTCDTTNIVQVDPADALGLWSWEKTAATMVAAQGGNSRN